MKQSDGARPPLTTRRVAVLAWRVGLLAWLTLTLWPVTYGITRIAQCLLFAAIFLGALFLWWRILWLRWTLILILATGTVLFAAPGRGSDAAALRSRYIAELKRFHGARYVWGGENILGIDCSGLGRRPLIHALWKEGFTTVNPALVRNAARLWWRDASARAMAAEYDDQTQRLAIFDRITSINPADLLAGDLAITSDGVHVLVHLGNREWIEADPGKRKVLILNSSIEASDPGAWLDVPVTLVRWRVLSSRP